ncbi:MAG TPA: ComF family protein [Thermohalobaculum sp.]|nr:ComF family protein [Thermohalobaculum sp.]
MSFIPPFTRLALPASVSGIRRTLVEALFPPACPACRGETASAASLCAECWAGTLFLSGRGCSACGRDVPGLAAPGPGFLCDTCQAHPPGWDRGASVFAYEGAGRRLVLALKHGDRLDMLAMLGPWMARAGRRLVAEADLVVPVPMHWTRRLKRRFNQSEELARALCRAAGRADALAPRLLRRQRRTASQDGRNRAARAENLRGAIALAPGAAAQLEGRRVLIVDDVLTTGATFDACAAACREAGAAGVDILALALVSFDEAPYLRSAEWAGT